MAQALFQLPDGRQAAFDIPEAPSTELQAAGQAAAAMPTGSPMPALAQHAQSGGQLALDIAKSEALPVVGGVVGGMAGGPAAGLATRGALAGVGSLAGRFGNAALGIQPPPSGLEQAAELAFGFTPETMAGALDPSTSKQIVNALSKRGGVPSGADALRLNVAVGGALRRRVGDIDGQARSTLNNMYRKVETLASAAGVVGQPSEHTLRAVQTVSEAMNDLGLTQPEKLRVQVALSRLVDDKPLDFAEMRKTWREVGELGDGFAKTLGRGPRNPLNTLAGSIKNDLRQMVAGTPAERRFEQADDYYVNDFLPTTRAVRNIDNAAPEDVVNALVKKPAHLRQVLSRVSPEMSAKMRTAWIAGTLEDARDMSGLPDVEALLKRFKALKGSARTAIVDDQASFRRAAEKLQELVAREGFTNQFRLLQSGALVGMGAGVGAALTTGNIMAGVGAMLGTTGGVYTLARIMHNTQARKLFTRGLALESRNAQAAGRLILQAGERAGVDWYAPNLRLDAPAAEAPQ